MSSTVTSVAAVTVTGLFAPRLPARMSAKMPPGPMRVSVSVTPSAVCFSASICPQSTTPSSCVSYPASSSTSPFEKLRRTGCRLCSKAAVCVSERPANRLQRRKIVKFSSIFFTFCCCSNSIPCSIIVE